MHRVPLSALSPPPPGPGRPGDPGVVVPHGEFWAVTAERAVLLGGPAALLLQVAHPLVAEGVARHSDYVAGPSHRLLATVQAFLVVTFGDTEQAEAVARHVGARHVPVRGTTGDGTPYSARDPELALWVHATLVRTAVVVAERYLGRRLDAAAREQHWQQSLPFARLFGVTDAVLPPSRAAFDVYWAQAVAALRVTDAARAVAADVLSVRTSPPLPGVPLLARAVTADLLPPSVAAQYGLLRTPARRVVAAAARTAVRAVRPVLPDTAARFPHARVAERRLAAGAGVSPARRPG